MPTRCVPPAGLLVVLPVAVTLLAPRTPAAPAPLDTTIAAIQGRGHYSPLAGRAVRVSGVVTSVAREMATLQDPAGDGDSATSDAVMVQLAATALPRPGDRVSVTGTVAEVVPGGERTANLSVTTIVRARIRMLGRAPLPGPIRIGAATPRPVREIISADELPVNLRDPARARANRFDPDADAIDWLEALEGMRVTVLSPIAVSGTQVFGPGAAEMVVLPEGGMGIAAGRRTAAGGILLQSGPGNLGSQNPERIQLQLDRALVPGPAPRIRVGDRLEDATGVVRYDFGNYEVAVTAPLRRRAPAPSLAGAAPRGVWPGRLAIATYNVLNLSPGWEDSLQRRLLGSQIAGALGAPPILALQEIQDDSGERDDGTTSADATLAALADAVRAAGGPDYRWVDVAPEDGRQGGVPGGNIRNAFLYDPARARLVRCTTLTPALLREAGAPEPDAFRDARDPLLGDFEVGGRGITVINNHLTSRYGSTPAYGAVQPFVQAGESARAAQVAALRAYVGGILARDPAARVAVLGDMNTFEFTDDLAALLPGTPSLLHPLADRVPAPQRYSYNYEGNSQALDHVFVTRALLDGAEMTYLHLNADFPALPGATASDHDPAVATLRW